MNNFNKKGPIIIGGVGGSGTRVVAQILIELDYYLGNDLNPPLDNLCYTLLFKRPKWFHSRITHKDAHTTGLGLFQALMTGNPNINADEWAYLARALLSISLYGHNYDGQGKGLSWVRDRLKKIIETRKEGQHKDYAGWGWKEPNSYLLLQQIADFFQDFRYIHVIRNGLDMALSRNQNQLHNWGALFNTPTPTNTEALKASSFEYWLKANRMVLELGETLGNDRFMAIDFDRLCSHPSDTINQLGAFLGINKNSDKLEHAKTIPSQPKSSGRNKNLDLSNLSPHHLSDFEDLKQKYKLIL